MGTVIDLLLPSVCPLCRTAHGADLCTPCRESLHPIDHPCPLCGLPTGGSVPCPGCHGRGLPWIDRVVAAWSYSGPLVTLITAAKAGARPAAVRACAHLMSALDLGDQDQGPHVVVPIPPSPGRRPGPHLATACARAVADQHGWTMDDSWLYVTRLADEQHRLNRRQRQANVVDLFACSSRKTAPATVWLVDDLVTSGATASAAAHTIRQAGAGRINAVVLGRTHKAS